MNQRSKGVRSYDEDYKTNNFEEIRKITAKEKELINNKIEDLVGTKGAIIFDKDLEIIKKIPASRLTNLDLDEEPYIIAMDGTATPRIIENCEKLGCSNLIANNFVNSDTRINLISM